MDPLRTSLVQLTAWLSSKPKVKLLGVALEILTVLEARFSQSAYASCGWSITSIDAENAIGLHASKRKKRTLYAVRRRQLQLFVVDQVIGTYNCVFDL